MHAPVGGVDVATILVKNQVNTFAPYQCRFTADSAPEFSVSPSEGSMNRRSEDTGESARARRRTPGQRSRRAAQRRSAPTTRLSSTFLIIFFILF